MKNLQFALTIEPDNEKIKEKLLWAQGQRQAGRATVPSSIEEETETNPFMRVDLKQLQVLLFLKVLKLSQNKFMSVIVISFSLCVLL